jgi:hemoglobin
MKHDIETLDDVKQMVDTFYARVQNDDKIGPIFNERIQDQWPRHLDIMYTFWQSILLGENTYAGQPFSKHINLPISEEHFARWLYLFHGTVSELFEGKNADEAKKRAAQIAAVFNSKLKMMRG